MVQFSLMSVRRPITEWLIRVPALQWHQGLLKILEADMQASSSQLHKVAFHQCSPRICTGTREPTSSFCCCKLRVSPDHAAVSQDAVVDLRVLHLGGRQEPRHGVDGCIPVVEAAQNSGADSARRPKHQHASSDSFEVIGRQSERL